jgi:MOSC domain-containing protein YiiM
MSEANWRPSEEGRVEDLRVTPFGSLRSVAVPQIQIVVGEGVSGDRHWGSRLSDTREVVLKRIGVGTEVPMANVRQISLIGAEDLERIGEEMGTPAPIPFGLCAENVVVSGLADLTGVPPGSLLTFSRHKDGRTVSRKAVVAVWGETQPCRKPHDNIVEHFDGFTPARAFASASLGRRGIVGFAYCSGRIKLGDAVTVWRPPARGRVAEVVSADAVPD